MSESLQAFLARIAALDFRRQLDALVNDQTLRWRAGEGVLVEAYLPLYSQLSQEFVLHLVLREILLRRERGEAPTLDEYVDRFPSNAEQLARQFALNIVLPPAG